MIDINLYNNKAFKWYNDGNIFAIGYIISDGKVIENEMLIDYFSNIKESADLKSKIVNVDGFFSVVIKNNNKILMASDIIRSFPLFISIDKNIKISDDINYFDSKKINKDSSNELLAAGYVTGSSTIYDDIFQIQNAEIISIDCLNKSISKERYFEYKYNILETKTDNEYFSLLNEKYNNSIKKMIMFLNGRRAVVPLSGGHDSRLLLYYLYKNGYKNVITYTYGRKNNPEMIISKNVADYLEYEWYFVEYKNCSMKKKYYDKNIYGEMADYCARGISTTHIQEWEAITELLKKGIISTEDVVIPGFSGDFIAGSHLKENLINVNNKNYFDICDFILKNHYNLYDWRRFDKDNKMLNCFSSKIEKTIDICLTNNVIDNIEFNELIEKFDFQERQVKFISNSVRTYDFNGIQWYMPLWDKELIDLWLSIPLEKRVGRILFENFVNSEYKELMDYAPIAKVKKYKKSKKNLIGFIQKNIKVFAYYFKHFLNYYGYIKFLDFVKICILYRTGSYYFIFSYRYVNYIEGGIKNEN